MSGENTREEVRPSALQRYAWAVVLVFLAGVTRVLLDRFLSYHHPFSTFFVAVLLAAWSAPVRNYRVFAG